jgi:hypothetical protein
MSQVKIDALKIKSLHERGLSRKEIAKETGYPMKAVNMAFNALGLKREKTVYVIEGISEDTVEVEIPTEEKAATTMSSEDFVSTITSKKTTQDEEL